MNREEIASSSLIGYRADAIQERASGIVQIGRRSIQRLVIHRPTNERGRTTHIVGECPVAKSFETCLLSTDHSDDGCTLAWLRSRSLA